MGKWQTFIDIGELGWSLYLSAHVRWIRNTQKEAIIYVVTFPDRFCLYSKIANYVKKVPKEFYYRFGKYQQDGFGLLDDNGQKVNPSILQKYFTSILPKECILSPEVSFRCKYLEPSKMEFAPYSYTKKYAEPSILLFPRCRKHILYKKRNLPKQFYIELITTLNEKFDVPVIALGSFDGAYTIDEIQNPNFRNLVGNQSLQQVIDYCSNAITAIGSASALPKLSLLQGVPTVVIGHQKQRCEEENWMGTPMMFWEIPLEGYEVFNDLQCIDQIVSFIQERRK